MAEDNCTDFKAESQDFLKALTTAEIVLLVICAILVILDFIIFADNVLYLWRKHAVAQIKTAVITATWLVGLCPIVASICWVSMVIPNAFLLRDVLITGCISVVMYKFIELSTLFIDHYDGLRERIKETQILRFDVGPVACCCKCLPTAKVKRHRVLILKGLVLQFPMISMPISVLTMYLWVDGKYRAGEYTASNPWPYLTAVKVLSTLTAMYALGILFAMVKEPLKMTYISQKYIGLKLCALTFNIQHFVFRVLTSNDVFDARECFSRRVMGDFYENTAFNFELFAISLYNLWAYRKPFTEAGSSANLESSAFEHVIYNTTSKDTGAPEAVSNLGFVEDDTMGRDEHGPNQASQCGAVINKDTAETSNSERLSYGACHKVSTSNSNHTQSSISDNRDGNLEWCRVCPQCGYDLHL